MLQGKVNVHGEPVVTISLLLHQRSLRFPAVVDTGFNGFLSIPHTLVKRGGWRFLGKEIFEIATGQSIEQPVYLGEVIFDQTRLTVYAVATDAKDVLIGTQLLENKILTIDFRKKRVRILNC